MIVGERTQVGVADRGAASVGDSEGRVCTRTSQNTVVIVVGVSSNRRVSRS